MKQMILAAAAALLFASAADAKTKKNCACVCTGHHGYSTASARNTDHSYDEAYSARWAQYAHSPARGARITSEAYVQKTRYAGYRQTYYPGTAIGQPVNLPNYTLNDNSNDGYVRPSPYLGDNGPTNDGPEKNNYRNINVANSSQPLPPNNGQVK